MKKACLFPVGILLLSVLLAACTEAEPGARLVVPGDSQSGPAPTATITPQPAPTDTIAATAQPALEEPAPTLALAATATSAPVVVAPTATVASTSVAPTPAASATTARLPTTVPARPATPVKTATPTPLRVITPVPTQPAAPYTGPLGEVARGASGRKQVAITLDAGAGSDPFPKMLAALNGAGVKITFFLTGIWSQQNPTFVQQIVASGHEIANHSWTHSDFTKLSEEKMREEMQKTDELLSKFTGRTTRPLWRPPYGARDARVLQETRNLGYRSIMWTIDSLDSVGQPKSAQFLIDRITQQTDTQLDGQIVLMHIGNTTTAEALPVILRNLRERGFKVVTVSQLLG